MDFWVWRKIIIYASLDIVHHLTTVNLNLPRLKSQGSWELSPNGKIFTKLSP